MKIKSTDRLLASVAVLALTAVPIVNLSLGTAQKYSDKRWWSRSVLYNLDFVDTQVNRVLYQLGISTEPSRVIIGKGGWLYLGDHFSESISVIRRGVTDHDRAVAEKIALASSSWKLWLSQRGVRLYKVMVGPDKGTIYPEYFPDWVRPATPSATDALVSRVDPQVYVDTRAALKAGKSEFSQPLYYRTDTHWNGLGAWLGFRAFMTEIDRTQTGLRLLSQQQLRIQSLAARSGGDLAAFLRIKDYLADQEVTIALDQEYPIQTQPFEFEAEHPQVSATKPAREALPVPVLTKSRHALNQRKVLWLTDSFGAAVTPYMNATFSETLQVHYNAVDPARLARLVDAYKPDYVFITVVERDARNRWFEIPAPATTQTTK